MLKNKEKKSKTTKKKKKKVKNFDRNARPKFDKNLSSCASIQGVYVGKWEKHLSF